MDQKESSEGEGTHCANLSLNFTLGAHSASRKLTPNSYALSNTYVSWNLLYTSTHIPYMKTIIIYIEYSQGNMKRFVFLFTWRRNKCNKKRYCLDFHHRK